MKKVRKIALCITLLVLLLSYNLLNVFAIDEDDPLARSCSIKTNRSPATIVDSVTATMMK